MVDPVILKKRCGHENIQFDVSAVATEGSNIIGADLAARCAACGVMFKWQGIFSSAPNLSMPSLSEDAEWLRLPMVAAGEIPRRPRILDKAEGAA